METPASLATVRRLAAWTPRVVTRRRTAVAISRRRSSWSTCLGICRSTLRFVMRMHCIESGSQCDRIVNLGQAQVKSGVTRNGDVQIAYEDFGKPSPGEKQRMLMDVTRLTEAKSLPLDDEWVRETAAESLRRHAPDRYARSRQLAAGFAAKLPAGGIARITQPVLVLNGDEDPIVRPAAGRMLARAGPPRRFLLVHRMGAHVLGATVAGTGQRDRPARTPRRARIVSATPLHRLAATARSEER